MTPTPSTIKRLSAGRSECTLTFAPEQTAVAEEYALRTLGKEVSLDGFRPGMAPLELLKEKISADRVFEEMIHHLLGAQLPEILKEHQLQPIIPPKVEAISREPMTVKVTFVEKPPVKIKSGKISVEKKEPKVEQKDIDRMMDYVLGQHRTITAVDRPVAEKDRVTLDLYGEDAEGKEIEGTRLEGRPVVIGSKELIPGFEDALIGLKTGEQKSFTLTFPATYQAEELRNKPVTFHATIRAVEEVKMPDLTDAFAQEHFQAPTAAEFKTRVEQSMEEQEEQIEQRRREQELLERIRKETTVELAPELVEEEERQLISELSDRLEQQKMTFEDWLKQTNQKPEDVRKEFQERARQRLTVRFGIEQLLEEHEVAIPDEEMATAVEQFLAPLGPVERKEAEQQYRPGRNAYEQFRWQRRVEKLMQKLLAA